MSLTSGWTHVEFLSHCESRLFLISHSEKMPVWFIPKILVAGPEIPSLLRKIMMKSPPPL